MFEEIASRSDCSFEDLKVGQEHLHCLIKSKPCLSSVAGVRRLKQESKQTFWSDGYFDTICRYIEQQG